MATENVLYSASFPGEAIKELAKIARAITDVINVKFTDSNIIMKILSPDMVSFLKITYHGDLIDYTAATEEKVLGLPVRYLEKFAAIIKNRDTVTFSFDGEEFILQGKNMKFMINPLTPETDRDVNFEPLAYVVVPVDDIRGTIKTLNSLKKAAIILITEDGITIMSNEREGAAVEYKKTSIELQEHSVPKEVMASYSTEVLTKLLSSISKNYSVTLGITDKKVLVLKFATAGDLGTAVYYQAPMVETE